MTSRQWPRWSTRGRTTRPTFERKSKKKRDDRSLVKLIWNLFDEADIVVAHNGDSFDQRKCNARFIELGLGPPSPYQTIDTKKVAARAAMNYSNKLDELSRRLGFGRKLDTLGFGTWLGCANEDPASWSLMRRYNIHDVVLLEQLYDTLTPWIDSVNMAHWAAGALACRRCGSTRVQRRGTVRTNASVFTSYRCNDCGGWSRAPKAEPQKPAVR
jgi:predicted RNA-binding Zn-ribbon protein involved in translation (DUF1610 family)